MCSRTSNAPIASNSSQNGMLPRVHLVEPRRRHALAPRSPRPAVKISLPVELGRGELRSRTPFKHEARAASDLEEAVGLSGRYRRIAQMIRALRARNQKLPASNCASSPKYSSRKPAFDRARSGANEVNPSDDRRRAPAVRAGPGIVAARRAAGGADLHPAMAVPTLPVIGAVSEPVERRLGGSEREPQPRIEVDGRGVVPRDRRFDGGRTLTPVPDQHGPPQAHADALALPLGGDGREVPVHAAIRAVLDDEEADQVTVDLRLEH